ncbi:MAG TPA: type IV toxin-antitoxin system AbiEi family antitoxin domain-containing protein [Solirubrobacteraceae bacterium]|nr:type IV toxin-antitoxin system AbiEi family antitoxin domain-containing protein [Solirubrobacteraceae bacterium]
MTSFANPPLGGKTERNAAIARLAGRQGGHVSRRQLLDLGLHRRAIESRLRAGWLLPVHRGVYAVGHLPSTAIDRARGALLAAGPRAALCGGSAAALWALHERWPTPVEVISPLQRRIPTLRARRCSTLLSRDVRTRDGLTVTSPARTLLDIAPWTAPRTLHRFHNELRMRRLVDNAALLDVAARNPLHPGARVLRALALASAGEAKRSSLELDWQDFAERHGLPPYEMNVMMADRRVDVLFTPDRLIVELDGWATHGSRRAFEDDRERDAAILAATGIPTIRITYAGLQRRPREQARRIDAILAARRATR